MHLTHLRLAQHLYARYQLSPNKGQIIYAGPWLQSHETPPVWHRMVRVRCRGNPTVIDARFIVEFHSRSELEVKRAALEGVPGANAVLMEYQVFIYAVVHAKVGPVEASSAAEAVTKAEERLNCCAAFRTQGRGGAIYTEYSDDNVGYLVDQIFTPPTKSAGEEVEVLGSTDLCPDGTTSYGQAINAIFKLIQQAETSSDAEQRRLARLAAAYHDFAPRETHGQRAETKAA